MSEVSFEEPAPESPRSRFAFLLRPWFLIVVTFLVVLVAIPLGYRTSRLAAIPSIEEIIDREVEGRIEIDPDRNAFTFYERVWKMAPPGLDAIAFGTGFAPWDIDRNWAVRVAWMHRDGSEASCDCGGGYSRVQVLQADSGVAEVAA